ncbi:MAG: YggS family pyridoxal phosphate-dependent enzyme [Candidatus Omnitrophica bacterium]|nr:YggS family pyridoxal phosphate-dependent enzyme [Candidatus Omnitrophota bacterium]
MSDIKKNVKTLLEELPPGIDVVAAAKTRTAAEIKEALDAGVRIIGENYVQEAEKVLPEVGTPAKWHFIGHLQKNKVKQAVLIFDMIETVDSWDLALEIDKRCRPAGKTMPVLIEINSAIEPQKHGVMPENARALIEKISGLSSVRVMGLMTMGPLSEDPECARPFFAKTRMIFDDLKQVPVPGTEMRYLSMGMTGSYRVAMEEGANMVRIGTGIFGERE